MADCEKGTSGHPRVHRVTVVAAEAEDLPICWICLDGPTIDRPLMHPCRCPSYVHASCIARWQLQSAGTRREKFCDFCNCELPDWKGVLTPTQGATAPAVMNVNFDNKTYSFHVAPGADGYRQFTEAIRRAFHLPDDSELNITFTCDEPSTAGNLLTLTGPGAYDAAVHCASVSAARRSTSSSTDRPLLPPLPLRQQQQGTAGSPTEDAQQPPTTPRLAADRQIQQPQQPQLMLPSRLSSASSSSSSIGSPDAAPTQPGLSDQQRSGRGATAGSNGDGGSSGSSSRLRRLSSRGRGGADGGSRSLSRSRSSGSAHSRNSSSNSLSEPDTASAPGCFPSGSSSGASGSSSLVADADRQMSSGSSSSGSSSNGSGRKGAGLGRKLRDALAELLISK